MQVLIVDLRLLQGEKSVDLKLLRSFENSCFSSTFSIYGATQENCSAGFKEEKTKGKSFNATESSDLENIQ